MTSYTVNDLIQAGVALLQAGQKAAAQAAFKQAISRQPGNDQAWLWISGTVESLPEQRAILQHVLELNPANLTAERRLAALDAQLPDVTLPDIALPPHGLPPAPPAALDLPLLAVTLPSHAASPPPAPPAALDISIPTVTLPPHGLSLPPAPPVAFDVALPTVTLPSHGASLPPAPPVDQLPSDDQAPQIELDPVELPAPWSPPEPLSGASLAEMAATCPGCEALVYGNAEFCWRCHAAIHCCATCTFVEESMCKELQQIATLHVRNRCPWWRPPA